MVALIVREVLWSFQQLPTPTGTDDRSVLVAILLAVVGAFGVVYRRSNQVADRHTARLERTVDEQTPLMRDLTAVLRQGADDAERRDGEIASLLREVLGELRRTERGVRR